MTPRIDHWAALAVLLAAPAAAGAQPSAVWYGHTDDVTCVAFSSDGTKALSGSQDQTVRLWDTATGKALRTFDGLESPLAAVAFSFDGLTALSVSDHLAFNSWDLATGRPVVSYPGYGVFAYAAAISPSGRRVLAGCDDRTLRVWSFVRGREVEYWPAHADYVAAVAFSPDGSKALAGGGNPEVWDAHTGKVATNLKGIAGVIWPRPCPRTEQPA